jgi:hypothetical protein
VSAEAVRVVEEIQTALTARDVVTALDDAKADTRDRRVRRVEFHIDRDVALRAAGLEPGSRP